MLLAAHKILGAFRLTAEWRQNKSENAVSVMLSKHIRSQIAKQHVHWLQHEGTASVL